MEAVSMNSYADLSTVDIVTYITEELQESYRSSNDKAKVFQEFLARWNGDDSSIAKVKAINYEFKSDLDWFNVTRPLSLAGLQGKIVVLDFFTYCCINCMHVLPELQALEVRYPIETGLVVVGVHSPKFENERNAANILAAAQRYGISHPIVNDSRSALWNDIGIRCWPTLLVLSPSGHPMLMLMGEGHGAFLQDFIGSALSYYNKQHAIDYGSLPLHLSTDLQAASNVRFPAKIARSALGRYAVTDAGNNRILVVSESGVVEHKIGGNEAGFVDGDLAAARFHNPQGVTFIDEETLIVADTENHALRQISLTDATVETLAGNGQQGHERTGGRVGPLQCISSPWDVEIFRTRDMDMSFHLDERNVLEKTIVLVAMAGTHQIWGYFPEGIIWWKFRKFEPRCCVALIGNGLEENRNNSYPQNAAFAQPSGLAIAKDFLFIADSESSSIRKASLVDGKVMPVVGGDRNPQNLFAFGDVDGKLFNAKLQHPLGVAYNHADDKVYVADTYNHKIKVIDTETNTVSSLDIKNEAGMSVTLKEPSGLCVDGSGKHLLISDTNNHELYKVELLTLTARRFVLDFSQLKSSSEIDAPRRADVLLKSLPLLRYLSFKLNFTLNLSPELKFTQEAPQKWALKSLNSVLEMNQTKGNISNGRFSIELRRLPDSSAVPRTDSQTDAVIEFSLSLCDTNCCLMKRFSVALTNANADAALVPNGSLTSNIDIHVDQSKITLA